MEDCYDLKQQFEKLILRGHLYRYLNKVRETSLRTQGPIEWQIDVIVEGPTPSGTSTFAHKTYTIEPQANRFPRSGDPLVVFKDEEVEHLDPEHDNTLVVSLRIVNALVTRS